MTTTPLNDWQAKFWEEAGHPTDHGVRAFDGELGTSHRVAHGRIDIRRTTQGRYYALVELDTALGHLCAAVHLEAPSGRKLVAAGGQMSSLAALDVLADRLDRSASLLTAAAAEQQVGAEMLGDALLVVRAHAGDDRARDFIRTIRELARQGDPAARARLLLLRQARAFARGVLGRTQTGDLFGDIGNAVSSAVKTVSNVAHDVSKVASDVGHVVGPVVDSIKQWGPEVLSDVQGAISSIPGIGTGISAAISAAEAVFDGGLDHPLEFAIRTAYGAIPIPPGIRPVCDTVLDAVLHFIRDPKNVGDDLIATVRDRIPSGLPQEVFDTLVHIVFHHSPIKRNPQATAAHHIARYTQGHAPALQRAMPLLPPALQGTLANLPDPKLQFDSIHKIAPHFTVDPAVVPHVLEHAAQGAGRPLPPDVAGRTTMLVQSAARQHAIDAAQRRLAQHAFEAHRIAPPGAPGASLAVEVSPDGARQRIVGTDSVAHLVGAVAS